MIDEQVCSEGTEILSTLAESGTIYCREDGFAESWGRCSGAGADGVGHKRQRRP